MGIKRIAFFSVVGMLLLTTTGCDINTTATRKQHQQADSLINVAYQTKNEHSHLCSSDGPSEGAKWPI